MFTRGLRAEQVTAATVLSGHPGGATNAAVTKPAHAPSQAQAEDVNPLFLFLEAVEEEQKAGVAKMEAEYAGNDGFDGPDGVSSSSGGSATTSVLAAAAEQQQEGQRHQQHEAQQQRQRRQPAAQRWHAEQEGDVGAGDEQDEAMAGSEAEEDEEEEESYELDGEAEMRHSENEAPPPQLLQHQGSSLAAEHAFAAAAAAAAAGGAQLPAAIGAPPPAGGGSGAPAAAVKRPKPGGKQPKPAPVLGPRKYISSQITVPILEREGCFNMTQVDAARHLGFGSSTVLKKVMRRLGIKQWPYRKRTSAKKITHSLEEYMRKYGDPAKVEAVLERVRMELAVYEASPTGSIPLRPELAALRQRLYKLDNKVKHEFKRDAEAPLRQCVHSLVEKTWQELQPAWMEDLLQEPVDQQHEQQRQQQQQQLLPLPPLPPLPLPTEQQPQRQPRAEAPSPGTAAAAAAATAAAEEAINAYMAQQMAHHIAQQMAQTFMAFPPLPPGMLLPAIQLPAPAAAAAQQRRQAQTQPIAAAGPVAERAAGPAGVQQPEQAQPPAAPQAQPPAAPQPQAKVQAQQPDSASLEAACARVAALAPA